MGLIPIVVKVEKEILERIDRLAKETGRNRSVVVREALERYIKDIGNTDEPIGNTHGQTIGNTKNLGLQEKLELLKQLGIELLEICKEQKSKLREEYPNVSLYEIYKYTDCPKVKKAISGLFRMSVET